MFKRLYDFITSRLFISFLLIYSMIWHVYGEYRFYYLLEKDKEVFHTTVELFNDMREDHQRIHSNFFQIIHEQNKFLVTNTREIDKLKGQVEVVDASINGNKKRKTRIETAIRLIKDTLPYHNPISGCPKQPSPGEIWSIAGAIIDNSDEYAVPAPLLPEGTQQRGRTLKDS